MTTHTPTLRDARPRGIGVHPAYQPLVRPETMQQAGRGAAALAHFSSLFCWLLGPALIFAVSRPGSYPRQEAAKAFNFQLITSTAFILAAILGGITNLDIFGFLMAIIFLAWLVLTIVGGAKALQGENWRNPVNYVVKLEALSEK
jgi:uncharacterized Tic20 family protein